MLRELRVRNLALLEDAHVALGPGLNAVTGATGAGKSLLLSALTLLLGGRFSREMLRTGADQAQVEGLFELTDPALAERVRELVGLDVDDSAADSAPREIVVKRRVDASGRNRCEVEGSLVAVGALRDLGRLLCEIHGQSEHQALLDPAEQTLLLDRSAGLAAEREAFAAQLSAWREARARVEALRTGARERMLRLEALDAVAREIREAGIRPGEQEELRRERNLLADATRHAESLDLALTLVEGAEGRDDDEAATDRLGRAARALEGTAALADEARAAQDAIDGALERLAEAGQHLRAARDRIESDPARLEEIEERLARLGQVLRRHGPREEDALAALAAAESEAHALRAEEDDAGSLDARLAQLQRETIAAGRALNDARRDAAEPFAANVHEALAELGMADTRFVVDVRDGDDAADLGARASALGLGRVEFLASPNPGEDLRPLARIASGGELARVALAIKGELAGADPVPLLVFDEIDADVGPRLGAVIGRRLAKVARGRQVLVVTHLPQVAAHADTHIRVRKETQGGRTVAEAQPISEAARELEIAEMIRGEGQGEEALDQARAMLAEARTPAPATTGRVRASAVLASGSGPPRTDLEPRALRSPPLEVRSPAFRRAAPDAPEEDTATARLKPGLRTSTDDAPTSAPAATRRVGSPAFRRAVPNAPDEDTANGPAEAGTTNERRRRRRPR